MSEGFKSVQAVLRGTINYVSVVIRVHYANSFKLSLKKSTGVKSIIIVANPAALHIQSILLDIQYLITSM